MQIGELLVSFLDTAGVGGLVVAAIYIAAFLTYIKLTRWILAGKK